MLNANNLTIAKHVSDGHTGPRSLQGLYVTPEATIACDGHMLVRMSKPQPKGLTPMHFPKVNGKGAVDVWKPFILDSQDALDIAKTLGEAKKGPELAKHAAIIPDGENVAIGTTDTHKVETVPVAGAYSDHAPQYVPLDKVLAEVDMGKKHISISLNAVWFKEICDTICKTHAKPKEAYFKLSMFGSEKAIRFDWENDDTSQEGFAMLMPRKLPKEEQGNSVAEVLSEPETKPKDFAPERAIDHMVENGKAAGLTVKKVSDDVVEFDVPQVKGINDLVAAAKATGHLEIHHVKGSTPDPEPKVLLGKHDGIRNGSPATVEVKSFYDGKYDVTFWRKNQRMPIGESVQLDEKSLRAHLVVSPAQSGTPIEERATAPEKPSGPRSWKPEVKTKSDPWTGNALRFPTKEEAEANVENLMMRWLAVTETRVVESDDEPNYKWVNGRLEAIEKPVTEEKPAPAPEPKPEPVTSKMKVIINEVPVTKAAPVPAKQDGPTCWDNAFRSASIASHDNLGRSYRKHFRIGKIVEAMREPCDPCKGKGTKKGHSCEVCNGSRTQVRVNDGPDGDAVIMDLINVRF
jgi:hypothetical protein